MKVGIKILNGQAVKEFRINGKEISKLYFSQPVTDELTANFPSDEGKNEQWWGYFLTLKVKPGAMSFNTMLHIDPVDLKYPDTQTVPILVCYEDQELKPSNTANILKGHSVFVAINPRTKSKTRR